MSEDSSENGVMLTPGAAASRLGISGSALRRLAVSYAEVYGELPEAAGGGRLFPSEAVERLRDARALLAAGRARSIRDALEALASGAQVSVESPPALGKDSRVLEVIAARLEAVERLEREVVELRREVGEMRALPPSGAEVEEVSPVAVVEPQRREQQGWIEETSRRGLGVGVRRPTDGGDEEGALVRLARRLERLLGRGRGQK